jgi:hypothetical protein
MVEKFEQRAPISNQLNTQRSPNIVSRCIEFCSRLRTLKPSWFDPNAQAVNFSSPILWGTECRTWEGRGRRQACTFSVGTTVARAPGASICSIEHENCSRLSGFSGRARRLRHLSGYSMNYFGRVERNAIDVRGPTQCNRGVAQLSGSRARAQGAARAIPSLRAPGPSAVDTPS